MWDISFTFIYLGLYFSYIYFFLIFKMLFRNKPDNIICDNSTNVFYYQGDTWVSDPINPRPPNLIRL